MIPSTLGFARPELAWLAVILPLLAALVVLAGRARGRSVRAFAGMGALSARSSGRMWLKGALLLFALASLVLSDMRAALREEPKDEDARKALPLGSFTGVTAAVGWRPDAWAQTNGRQPAGVLQGTSFDLHIGETPQTLRHDVALRRQAAALVEGAIPRAAGFVLQVVKRAAGLNALHGVADARAVHLGQEDRRALRRAPGDPPRGRPRASHGGVTEAQG